MKEARNLVHYRKSTKTNQGTPNSLTAVVIIVLYNKTDYFRFDLHPCHYLVSIWVSASNLTMIENLNINFDKWKSCILYLDLFSEPYSDNVDNSSIRIYDWLTPRVERTLLIKLLIHNLPTTSKCYYGSSDDAN